MKKQHSVYKYIISIFVALLYMANLSAQEEEVDKRPVPEPFYGTSLIDNQTSVIPYEKGLQFVINHRFGTFEKGFSDLYGIYAPSNIRMGFNYSLSKKLMIGLATEKNNQAQEGLLKYNILEQTRSNSMPFTLTFYGNMVIDASDEIEFGEEYEFAHRMSYFSQFILSRKFSDKLSLMAAPGFLHMNTAKYIDQNQRVTFMAGGKYNVINMINLLVEYHNSASINSADENQEEFEPEGNLGFACELVSGTHTFQITLSQFNQLVNQYNYAYNKNDLKDGWLLGFNIMVRFY